MGLSRTVSEINRDFSRKSQNFPTPVYFAPRLTEFPLELASDAMGKNENDGLPDGHKSFKIGLTV